MSPALMLYDAAVPLWRLGRPRGDDDDRTTPSPLDAIDAQTPLRFRLHLADPGQRHAAEEALRARLPGELTVEAAGADGDGTLEVASRFSPASAALQRPLNVLERAGVVVNGLAVLGLVTELDDDALRRAVHAWDTHGNQPPHRLRLELLAGSPLLERCLAALAEAPESGPDRRATWSFALRCVTFNTPGAERRVIEAAAATRNERDGIELVNAAEDRVRLATLSGQPVDIPADALAAVIGRGGYLGERASHLADLLPAPLPAAVASALCAAAAGSGERAAAAIRALRHAEPDGAVRSVLEAALASNDAGVQADALGVFAHHWGVEARPTWRAFLATRSAPLRWSAEAILGQYGTEADLDDAAAHLARLVRAPSKTPLDPPRGNEIVELLVRHADHPTARTALDDLSARWDRLEGDLRSWLAEHHPSLDPARRTDRPREVVASAEAMLAFPPPTIEREPDAFRLWFDEAAAHTEARDRFEELAARHADVEILDGDREWLTIRCTAPDPAALVHKLWSAASRGAGRPDTLGGGPLAQR